MACRSAPSHAHAPGGRRAGARQDGFTLLETLLVVALMAAAAVLAAMVFTGGMEGMRLRSESKEIAAQLRYTRAQAISTGEPQRFVIDPAARTWQAPDGRQGVIPDALEVRFTGARQVQPTRGEGAVMFFGDGAATGGRIQLRRDSAAWNIDVAWLTGEVTLARDGGSP